MTSAASDEITEAIAGQTKKQAGELQVEEAVSEYADMAPNTDLPANMLVDRAVVMLEDICGSNMMQAAALSGKLVRSLSGSDGVRTRARRVQSAASVVDLTCESMDEVQSVGPCGDNDSIAGGNGQGSSDTNGDEPPETCEALCEEMVPMRPFQPETISAKIMQWRLPSHYELGVELGSGTFGVVRVARDKEKERLVAVKRVCNLFTGNASKRTLREIALLSRLHHSHIVRILDLPPPLDLGSFDELYIVMELCDTSLEHVCKHSKGLSLAQARKLAYGLVLGCSYLHSACIYHRDLKPGNCLVNRDCAVKICDFNLSRVVGDPTNTTENPQIYPQPQPQPAARSRSRSRSRSRCRLTRSLTKHVVTRWYRAPEVILTLGYSELMDVWAAGCIIAEMFAALSHAGHAGRKPNDRILFPGEGCYPLDRVDSASTAGDQLSVIFDVLGTPSKQELEELPHATKLRLNRYVRKKGCGLRAWLRVEVCDEGIDLLEQMLKFLPDDRIAMIEALSHTFFARVTRRLADEEELANTCVDIGFDDDAAMKSKPKSKDMFYDQIRKQLRAEIAKFQTSMDVPGKDQDPQQKVSS